MDGLAIRQHLGDQMVVGRDDPANVVFPGGRVVLGHHEVERGDVPVLLDPAFQLMDGDRVVEEEFCHDLPCGPGTVPPDAYSQVTDAGHQRAIVGPRDGQRYRGSPCHIDRLVLVRERMPSTVQPVGISLERLDVIVGRGPTGVGETPGHIRIVSDEYPGKARERPPGHVVVRVDELGRDP